jgi:hypothetical protein
MSALGSKDGGLPAGTTHTYAHARRATVINAAPGWLIPLVLLLLAGPTWAATTVTVGTDLTKFVIKGKIVTPEQVIDGELVIEGDQITCVATSCTDPPAPLA